MIKLERIYVQNYKNIAEADLELGNMNVIVGENGSGKSNLLSAIPLLKHIIYGSISDIKSAFDNGGIFPEFGNIWNNALSNHLREPLIIKIDFSNTESNTFYTYEIQFESIQIHQKLIAGIDFQYKGPSGLAVPEPIYVHLKTQIVYESLSYKLKSKTGKPISIFKRQNKEVVYGNGIKKTDSISNIDEYTSILRLLNLIRNSKSIANNYRAVLNIIEYIFYSNVYFLSPQSLKNPQGYMYDSRRIISFELGEEIFYLLNTEGDLHVHFKDRYKNVLKTILGIDEIVSDGFRDSNGQPYYLPFVVQGDKSKPPQELSDGSLVLLALITKIFSDGSDIFFIEEPENSIHPRALYELIKLIREKSLDKQFIITTHSSYLLNMIKPDEVLVAEIEENGLSKIEKLPNVKAIKKKLAKSFMSFGDIVFAGPDTDEDSE